MPLLYPRPAVAIESERAPEVILGELPRAVTEWNRRAVHVRLLRAEQDPSGLRVGWWSTSPFWNWMLGGLAFDGRVEARGGGSAIVGVTRPYPPWYERRVARFGAVGVIFAVLMLAATEPLPVVALVLAMLCLGRIAVGVLVSIANRRIRRVLEVAAGVRSWS